MALTFSRPMKKLRGPLLRNCGVGPIPTLPKQNAGKKLWKNTRLTMNEAIELLINQLKISVGAIEQLYKEDNYPRMIVRINILIVDTAELMAKICKNTMKSSE